jgi:hypothetical protein
MQAYAKEFKKEKKKKKVCTYIERGRKMVI